VFADGNPQSRVMFVGKRPAATDSCRRSSTNLGPRKSKSF